jgi:hypothetical protein
MMKVLKAQPKDAKVSSKRRKAAQKTVISLFAQQFEPSNGYLALRKLMANGRWMVDKISQCKLFSTGKSVNEFVIAHGA